MPEPLTIAPSGTPNPNAVKFTLNRTVAAKGTTYRDAQSADADWAKQLLGVAGVTQVFALNDFISITKVPDGDWNVVGPQVEAILRHAFT